MARWILFATTAAVVALAGFSLAACGGKRGSGAGGPAHTTFTLPLSAITITETSPRVATVTP